VRILAVPKHRKHGLLALLLAWLLMACAGPTSAPVPERATPTLAQVMPTATATLSAAQDTGSVDWVRVDGVENLADDPSWGCQDGITLRNRGFEVAAEDGYRTVVHAQGPVLAFSGDWSITATLEVLHGEWGALVLFGALPQDAWWEGIQRLDLEWNGQALNAVYWDGSAQQPAASRSFPAPGAPDQVQVGLRREGAQLHMLVEGQEVGQFDDPGMFPNGRSYLGANVPPGAALYIYEIEVGVPRGSEHTLEVQHTSSTGTYVAPAQSLRELAQARGLTIGAAVSATPLRCDPTYAEALRHEFNLVTTENAMKFGPIHPEPGRYAFRNADDIVDTAEAQGMRVRGHTLVWHQQLPSWVEGGEWTREELLEVLHEHIATVVGRYKGRIYAWDVVNEAIDGDTLRDTVWSRVIGPEYIDLAFRWAHEADPDALLFYNDYGGEGINRKSDAIYDLVAGMIERGVPVHGVGLQMHLISGLAPLPGRAAENMERLGALGLQVHVTELDVRIRGVPAQRDLATQARTYQQVAETCLAARNCTALVTWGLTDRYSWVPSRFTGWGSALLLDETYEPKPAYLALADALRGP
jgi:endo-1,4-beta-xylanase